MNGMQIRNYVVLKNSSLPYELFKNQHFVLLRNFNYGTMCCKQATEKMDNKK